jgi:1-acyl-sn-glycerol-3-phosphate acyltransferase
MAVRAGVPIVPVVCESYSKLLKPGKYFRRGTLKLRGKFAARSGAVALAPFPHTN